MIQLKGAGELLVKSTVRTHEILSDTNEQSGGHDEAMNPHEILETALGACTSITLKMYAKRKGMKLDDVVVEVHTVSEGKQSVLSRKIKIIGTLTDEESKRLMDIADKCPIHKLLTSQITIQTQPML
jgi:putative redox protein